MELYINGVIKNETFWDCLFSSLSIITLRSIQVIEWITGSFLLLSHTEWYESIIVCVSTYLLKDLWIISSFWLLQIKLLRTLMKRKKEGRKVERKEGRKDERKEEKKKELINIHTHSAASCTRCWVYQIYQHAAEFLLSSGLSGP